MLLFVCSLVALIAGYIIYGTVVERIFGVDPSRLTPCLRKPDGVDFVPMPVWKVFLIQFLNIAGLGPIFGAIMGAMFGPAAFLWIVFGTIFAGGVHDFISAMMSLRSDGASLPELQGRELGRGMKTLMRLFCIVLLLMVSAVFVVSPAGILGGLFAAESAWSSAMLWIAIIFGYYVLATLLPIDRVIGRLYPIMGFALLFMAVGIMGYLFFGPVEIPMTRFSDAAIGASVFPIMFVSIACGAISGFHATQSPMMARCLTNEKLARPVFYGAMVAEGIVALIWAAAAIAFTGGYSELGAYLQQGTPAGLVKEISIGWLGTVGGVLAILGVVAAPITTGDTALRSARLMTADIFRIDQAPMSKRLMVSVPIFIVCAIITAFAIDPPRFAVVWRYFAWLNQTLAVFTLWACTVYLKRHGRAYIITLLPAMFMTVVSVSFMLVAPASQGGLGVLSGSLYPYGVAVGCVTALIASYICLTKK